MNGTVALIKPDKRLCRTRIFNNMIKTKFITIPAVDFLPSKAVLKGIRVLKNAETEVIDHVKYDCVNPVDFSTFTIKVPDKQPIISPEQLESATGVLYIDIPVDRVEIRPYAIEYGIAKVSIVAPEVRLHKGGTQNA